MAESDPVLDLSNLTQPNNHTTSDDGLAILKRFIALDLSKKLLDDGTHLVGYNHWVLDDYVNLTNGEVLDLSRDRITQDEADALLKHDLVVVEKAVNSHVMVPLSQGQFDALVSFVANVGPVAFGQSDVLQAINRGQLGDVPGLLRAMTVVDNIPVQTLKQRRAFEVRLWNRKL